MSGAIHLIYACTVGNCRGSTGICAWLNMGSSISVRSNTKYESIRASISPLHGMAGSFEKREQELCWLPVVPSPRKRQRDPLISAGRKRAPPQQLAENCQALDSWHVPMVKVVTGHSGLGSMRAHLGSGSACAPVKFCQLHWSMVKLPQRLQVYTDQTPEAINPVILLAIGLLLLLQLLMTGSR